MYEDTAAIFIIAVDTPSNHYPLLNRKSAAVSLQRRSFCFLLYLSSLFFSSLSLIHLIKEMILSHFTLFRLCFRINTLVLQHILFSTSQQKFNIFL